MTKKTTAKAATPKAPKSGKPTKGKKAVASKPVASKAVAKKAKPVSDKKLSAIDAAAQVLASAKEPLNAKQMIAAMTAKGLWTSPGGKTPHATLYSAILREIGTKGNDARFKKTDRGHFTTNA